VTGHTTFFKSQRPTWAERLKARRKPIGYRAPKSADKVDYEVLGIPKGPTRRQEKDRRLAAEDARKRLIHAQVWERSPLHCETCGNTEAQTALESPKAAHEMNELLPRSATKGMPVEERFNLCICLRQCQPCHRLFHAELLEVQPLSDVHGMNGDYNVIAHGGVAPVVTPIIRPRVFVPATQITETRGQ
jgi:hypothetical protein